MILSCLFKSTVVYYGPDYSSTENTSILRTCRQIYREGQPLLAPNVLLKFHSAERMVDCLTAISSETLQQLRTISVKAFPLPTRTKGSSFTTYQLAAFLPLFQGLQLDVLEVLDCYHDPGVNDRFGDDATYFHVEHLCKFPPSYQNMHL